MKTLQADTDASGNVKFAEFCRKFSHMRATASVAHGDAVDKSKLNQFTKEENWGGSSAAAGSSHRKEENVVFGVDDDQYDANAGRDPPSILVMSRDKNIHSEEVYPLAEASPDIVRAKIVSKHGGLVNGFKQLDIDGSGKISFEEFEKRLPQVLGMPYNSTVPAKVVETIFEEFDSDVTGFIDLDEFMTDALTSTDHPMTVRWVNDYTNLFTDNTTGAGAKVSGFRKS